MVFSDLVLLLQGLDTLNVQELRWQNAVVEREFDFCIEVKSGVLSPSGSKHLLSSTPATQTPSSETPGCSPLSITSNGSSSSGQWQESHVRGGRNYSPGCSPFGFATASNRSLGANPRLISENDDFRSDSPTEIFYGGEFYSGRGMQSNFRRDSWHTSHDGIFITRPAAGISIGKNSSKTSLEQRLSEFKMGTGSYVGADSYNVGGSYADPNPFTRSSAGPWIKNSPKLTSLDGGYAAPSTPLESKLDANCEAPSTPSRAPTPLLPTSSKSPTLPASNVCILKTPLSPIRSINMWKDCADSTLETLENHPSSPRLYRGHFKEEPSPEEKLALISEAFRNDVQGGKRDFEYSRLEILNQIEAQLFKEEAQSVQEKREAQLEGYKKEVIQQSMRRSTFFAENKLALLEYPVISGFLREDHDEWNHLLKLLIRVLLESQYSMEKNIREKAARILDTFLSKIIALADTEIQEAMDIYVSLPPGYEKTPSSEKTSSITGTSCENADNMTPGVNKIQTKKSDIRMQTLASFVKGTLGDIASRVEEIHQMRIGESSISRERLSSNSSITTNSSNFDEGQSGDGGSKSNVSLDSLDLEKLGFPEQVKKDEFSKQAIHDEFSKHSMDELSPQAKKDKAKLELVKQHLAAYSGGQTGRVKSVERRKQRPRGFQGWFSSSNDDLDYTRYDDLDYTRYDDLDYTRYDDLNNTRHDQFSFEEDLDSRVDEEEDDFMYRVLVGSLDFGRFVVSNTFTYAKEGLLYAKKAWHDYILGPEKTPMEKLTQELSSFVDIEVFVVDEPRVDTESSSTTKCIERNVDSVVSEEMAITHEYSPETNPRAFLLRSWDGNSNDPLAQSSVGIQPTEALVMESPTPMMSSGGSRQQTLPRERAPANHLLAEVIAPVMLGYAKSEMAIDIDFKSEFPLHFWKAINFLEKDDSEKMDQGESIPSRDHVDLTFEIPRPVTNRIRDYLDEADCTVAGKSGIKSSTYFQTTYWVQNHKKAKGDVYKGPMNKPWNPKVEENEKIDDNVKFDDNFDGEERNVEEKSPIVYLTESQIIPVKKHNLIPIRQERYVNPSFRNRFAMGVIEMFEFRISGGIYPTLLPTVVKQEPPVIALVSDTLEFLNKELDPSAGLSLDRKQNIGDLIEYWLTDTNQNRKEGLVNLKTMNWVEKRMEEEDVGGNRQGRVVQPVGQAKNALKPSSQLQQISNNIITKTEDDTTRDTTTDKKAGMIRSPSCVSKADTLVAAASIPDVPSAALGSASPMPTSPIIPQKTKTKAKKRVQWANPTEALVERDIPTVLDFKRKLEGKTELPEAMKTHYFNSLMFVHDYFSHQEHIKAKKQREAEKERTNSAKGSDVAEIAQNGTAVDSKGNVVSSFVTGPVTGLTANSPKDEPNSILLYTEKQSTFILQSLLNIAQSPAKLQMRKQVLYDSSSQVKKKRKKCLCLCLSSAVGGIDGCHLQGVSEECLQDASRPAPKICPLCEKKGGLSKTSSFSQFLDNGGSPPSTPKANEFDVYKQSKNSKAKDFDVYDLSFLFNDESESDSDIRGRDQCRVVVGRTERKVSSSDSNDMQVDMENQGRDDKDITKTESIERNEQNLEMLKLTLHLLQNKEAMSIENLNLILKIWVGIFDFIPHVKSPTTATISQQIFQQIFQVLQQEFSSVALYWPRIMKQKRSLLRPHILIDIRTLNEMLSNLRKLYTVFHVIGIPEKIYGGKSDPNPASTMQGVKRVDAIVKEIYKEIQKLARHKIANLHLE